MRSVIGRAMAASVVGVVSAAVAFAVVVATPADAADDPQWAMGGHDISNTRSNPTETILSPATVGGLRQDWTYTTRGPVSATPAVVDGAVYIPDWGGWFHKVDANTGAVIWSRSVGSYVGSSETIVSRTHPVVVGTTVYIGTQTGARLLAVDTANGNLRWNVATDPHPDAVLTGGALYYDGVLYQGVSSLEFSRAGETGYDCCTFRGSLVAFNASTGAQPGGFQGEVTVRATRAITGWTVGWSFANGQRINQAWNGTATTSGASVTVRNVAYNGNLPANGSTTFGFLASWTGSNAVPASFTCTSP